MFSWSTPNRGTGPQPGYPGARTSNVVAQPIGGSIRPPEYSRAQHIESYLNDDTLKKSTRRVSSDDSTYDTVFQTTRGDTLIVRVHLPIPPNVSTRNRAPAMTMAGVKARHPWLDSRMRVTGYIPIQTDETWKSSRMLLGQAVHEVVKHLQIEPPEVLEITDAGLRSIQSKQSSYGSRAATTNNSATRSSTGNHASSSSSSASSAPSSGGAPPDYSSVLKDMPDIPRVFPELDALSREELEQLLEDELDFIAFVNKLPIFHTIQSTANKALNENAATAKSHVEKQEKLETLYKDVTELKGTFEAKIRHFLKLEQEQDALCAPPDTRDVMRKLAKGKKEALQESEQIADDWVEDGSNVDDFVRSFVEKRRVHHLRAAKIELLQTTIGKKL